jgi:hypothetical protein
LTRMAHIGRFESGRGTLDVDVMGGREEVFWVLRLCP